MNLPTPETDPSGLAGGASVAVSTVLVALGATDVVAAKWAAAAVAVVNLVAFVWTRRKAFAPITVANTVAAATLAAGNEGYSAALNDVKPLAPARPVKKATKRR